MGESGSITLEGSFLIERAVGSGLEIEEIVCVPARESWCHSLGPGLGLEPKVLAEAEISALAGYPFHRGVLARARRPPAREAGDLVDEISRDSGQMGSTILAVPELADPENLGSCFRNAAALGCSCLLLGPNGPDPLSRRSLRVSMGASLSLPWARLEGPAGLAELDSKGFAVAACVLDPEALDVRGWARPSLLALAMGNEAYGLSSPWLEACELRLTLPMRGGVDSLNVATAAALFLFAISPDSRRASVKSR